MHSEKHDLILEMIKKLKSKPNFKRKLKIVIAVSLVFFVLSGSVVIWAGIKIFNHITFQSSEMISSPSSQAQIDNLKLNLMNGTKINIPRCWEEVQSLLTVQPWLEHSTAHHLKNLKLACIGKSPPPCENENCIENLNESERTVI